MTVRLRSMIKYYGKSGRAMLPFCMGYLPLCIAALDFSFLCSKYRVVQTKEERVKLALSLASGASLDEWTGTPLLTLLYNSGEGRAKVLWKGRPSIWPIALLYLGMWGPTMSRNHCHVNQHTRLKCVPGKLFYRAAISDSYP